ncbi:metalloregulator ArsR/SmtB family transcription factor [Acholeplasma vituli]|uniref:Metalloregulator ArsR/SmtB family transcription factor n=1 Tax=Paracholeplasma vituli TaxID=69473 RepID=A0ABT2PX34_9MOLU|nr:metalloregulator ArsR/SmtB family transcription factor [Paracholeplasma vituli]MCU0105520.1 metalloregulator ArsR/SmtB family transcription factor [Paracholeplasma vituli]
MEHQNCGHELIMESIKHNMIQSDELDSMVELFKVLSDSTRIKILYAISKHEICVNDIAKILNMTQSAVSHQLKNLKQAKLISSRREGQTMYYRLSDDHVHLIFNQALDHIRE